MFAPMARALLAATALAVATPYAAFAADAAPAKPAKKPAVAGSSKPAATRKPATPAPPAPPPPVELIGYVTMPAGGFRGGPPSGQFDNEGRRAAAPRFDSQPVQGVSSIKPGPTSGVWWALSDNGYGRKWNSWD